MRKLIHVPMVHEPETSVFKDHSNELKVLRIKILWKQIEEEIGRKNLNDAQVKIFLDGVAEGKELNALRPHHPGILMKIVRDLVLNGATLVGVEDQRLIDEQLHLLRLGNAFENNLPGVEELEGYQYHQRMINSFVNMENCLKKRDRVIAKGINKNLTEGETGILFLGYQHGILSRLDKDIQVENLGPEVEELHEEIRRDYFPQGGYEEIIEKHRRLRDSFLPHGQGPERR